MKTNLTHTLLGLLILFILSSDNHACAEKITTSGELVAVEKDSYSPPSIRSIWRYTIAFMADDGSLVNPGQPVLMFKTEELQERLMDKQGELKIKQSELLSKQSSKVEELADKALAIEEMKKNLDKARRKAELPKSVIALNDYKENQLNYDLAQLQYQHALDDLQLAEQKIDTEIDILNANITKLKAEVKEAEESIASMRVMAKRRGIIMHQTDHNNNKYAIGDQVWGGARVVEVADMDNIIAQLEIKENDLSRVKKGQQVIFNMDAYPDIEFTGIIEELSKVVRVKSQNQPSKILDAKVIIDNPDNDIMRPNMSIKAQIINES
ncbi:MAG: HlyD family efflux transporter periplasmic adaptor subunit [Proteobacteria bacterium]|nr:MAG: HlyD family efflux transporter periplasmic adaptor subunit [Pseudomonadota bacterium]